VGGGHALRRRRQELKAVQVLWAAATTIFEGRQRQPKRGAGDGQRTLLVRFRKGLSSTTKSTNTGYAGTHDDDGWVYCEKTSSKIKSLNLTDNI